jgi:hypothetical protein
LLPDLIERLGAPFAERSDDGAIVLSRAHFSAHGQRRAQGRGADQITPMTIDAILQTCIALGITAAGLVEHQGSPVGKDQPRPDKQDPLLAEDRLGVIGPDQFRPLRTILVMALQDLDRSAGDTLATLDAQTLISAFEAAFAGLAEEARRRSADSWIQDHVTRLPGPGSGN